MEDERELVERARRSDPEALSRLYETYFDRIYRYVAVRVGSTEEAEDLTQQVFLQAFEALPSFKWRGVPFSSWLFRIAHSQVVDHHRKASRTQVMPLEVPVAVAGPDPCEEAEREMALERVREALASLTELQREVISLRFAAGLSTAETAKTMGKREGAIKALQHSALAALRRALSRETTEDVRQV